LDNILKNISIALSAAQKWTEGERKMRDRLIELLNKAQNDWLRKEYDGETSKELAEYVADHLLAEGVIALPCKFGQTVFVICNTVERIELEIENCIYETKIDHISIGAKGAEFHLLYRCITHPDCDWFIEKDIGKTVFLTREEAEKALAERREGCKPKK
jgi:hypothetical protein